MIPKTLAPTPSGTASTERTPCSITVPPMKRGSACASEVKTDLPLATTSSMTDRLMRISPTSPTRTRHRNFQFRAFRIAHHDHAAIGGHSFKYQRDDLLESFVQCHRSEQCDTDLANQSEEVALLRLARR